MGFGGSRRRKIQPTLTIIISQMKKNRRFKFLRQLKLVRKYKIFLSHSGPRKVIDNRCEVIDNKGSEMERFLGRKDDGPGIVEGQLLQLVGNQALETSSNDNDQGEPKLEQKHKIFLCHSGAQKDFTEQLCVDLERFSYYPFFDKRPDSLPKGKMFPELIFEATQQCRVAVLILSEEFFTRSKWPMLELEAFVKAKKKDPEKISILPVYLTTSLLYECTKNEARRSKWVSVWREWAEIDDRINVEKWVEALRALAPLNGIENVQGEVILREQIVQAIRVLVRPEITWSGENIKGRTRITEAIREKFRTTNPSVLYGVRVVGIYGMGGMGKTTFCQVLCDELWTEFQGKVCHAISGKSSSIELQKQVLRDLTDVNHGSLTNLTNVKAGNLLGKHLKKHRVFLALDNIWQDSFKETKDYLTVGFHPGSIVMVTARSIDILVSLGIVESDCLEMLELDEEDAKQLFLHHAAPKVQFKSQVDEERILYCVRKCKFQKGANMGEHFLPLALEALGTQLGSLPIDPKKWVENLENSEKGDRFNQLGEKKDPIFSVLGIGYDSLSEENQLLFIDVVLMCPYLIRKSSKIYLETLPGRVCPIFSPRRIWSSVDVFEWLSIVHKTKVEIIKKRLQHLKAKSLLENIGNCGVSVHDLYIDFAEMEVKRGSMDIRRWVWYDQGECDVGDLALMPCGYCWQNIKRVHLYKHRYRDDSIRWTGNIEGVKWQHFSNIVVLNLCAMAIEELDLGGLRCLRSLGLQWESEWKIECKLTGLAKLKELAWLDLRNMKSLSHFKEIGSLTALKVLHLHVDDFQPKEFHSPPNLDKCTALQELVLKNFYYLNAFPNLSKLRSLRAIVFDECRVAKKVVGLNNQMCSLQFLSVSNCRALSHIFGLEDLVSLQELEVQDSGDLEQPLNLCKLTNLKRLTLKGKFKKVLGFNELMLLHDLRLGDVEELHDMHLLRNLHQLEFQKFSGSTLPQFGNCTTLEFLDFNSLSRLQKLLDMNQLSRLRTLIINHAPQLVLELPILGGLVALEWLWLEDCGTSVGTAKLPDLHKLTNLRLLILKNTPIKRLPSLKHLTQLMEFACKDTQLAKLPNLSGSTLLKYLDLSGCHELTSVGNLGILPALVDFKVSGCHKLGRLPNLESLTQLNKFACNDTQLTKLPDFSGLTLIKHLDLSGCRELTGVDNLAILPALVIFNVSGCHKLERLPNLGSLTQLKKFSCNDTQLAELPDLGSLTQLEKFSCNDTQLAELPDLGNLTQLKKFACNDTQLAKLPDLSGSTLLKHLHLSGCRELTSVGNLGIMPDLMELNVSGCHKLQRLPNLRSFKSLQRLHLYRSRVRLSSDDIMFLVASWCSFAPWNHKSYLHPTNTSQGKIEAMQLEYFAIETTIESDIDSSIWDIENDPASYDSDSDED